VFAQIGAWGRKHLPASEELSIRAEVLEAGGPVSGFADTVPIPDTSRVPKCLSRPESLHSQDGTLSAMEPPTIGRDT
jgi:hypothetical protein